MSRCFPFPPPGYEKKLRVEDVTLLAKEKGKEGKEKKHKKDKDKEKKEGREKDRKKSKDGHKEKDKEKRSHKDRDKKNEKKRSRDEKRLDGGDRSNVEKVGSNSPQSSCVQELGQRINFVDAATRNQPVHTVCDEGKAEFLDAVANRRNGVFWTEGNNGLDQTAIGQRDSSASKLPKVVFSNGPEQRTVQIGRPLENDVNKKDVQKHHINNRNGEKSEIRNAKRHKGEAGTVPQDSAVVRDLEQRIRVENGTVGSHIGAKANVIVQKRPQNATAFSHMKESSESEGVSRRLENGQKVSNHSKVPKVSIVHNSQSKVPKVAIVHNLKTKERGCEVAGVVDTGKKSPLEGTKTNGYCEKGAVDNNKVIHPKEEDRDKLRNQEKVKEESDCVAEPSRIGQNVSDLADTSKRYTFKMVDKTAGVVTGKRKETEMNGILHGDMRPNKLQRTAQSSQPFPENGRHLKTSTTITLSSPKMVPASGLRTDIEELKSNWTVPAPSPPVLKETPTTSMKAVGSIRSQSPLGSTKQFTSLKASEVGARGPPVGPPKPPLTEVKVNEVIMSHAQGPPNVSPKPPSTEVKVNEPVMTRAPAPNTTKDMPSIMGKNQEKTVGCLESAKPPVTPEKFNGIIAAHASPLESKKPPSTSRKEKHKHKSSSKPPSPHPDTKYLSQILTVPNVEELPELDDSEWLFESKSLASKELGEGHDKDVEEQAWAKAVHIKSADIYALPYVIPY